MWYKFYSRYFLIQLFFISLINITGAQTFFCNVNDTSICFIQKKYNSGIIGLEKILTSKDFFNTFQTPLLADFNGDCIPEIVVNGQTVGDNSIKIIDSKTGQTIRKIVCPGFFSSPTVLAIADVDNDAIPEILVAIGLFKNSTIPEDGKIICYNFDGTTKWISDQKHTNFQNRNIIGNLGLADFNQDGIPEVYYMNKIFNAQTGVLIADGGANGIGHSEDISITIAAQLDDDISDLELAAGYTTYKVIINNPLGIVGNQMIPNNIMIDGKQGDGKTSVADLNNDGILDIIVHSEIEDNKFYLYAYTMAKSTISIIAKVSPPFVNYPKGYQHPTSTPVIGKLNSTAKLSIMITRPYNLLCYEYDDISSFVLKWSLPTSDESGFTGITLFDLNGDNVNEIIYRDETTLRILNVTANIPMEIATTPCYSVTGGETPIVADIFNSNQSNICVICSDLIQGFEGRLNIYGSPKNLPKWIPSRNIWNQDPYHILVLLPF